MDVAARGKNQRQNDEMKKASLAYIKDTHMQRACTNVQPGSQSMRARSPECGSGKVVASGCIRPPKSLDACYPQTRHSQFYARAYYTLPQEKRKRRDVDSDGLQGPGGTSFVKRSCPRVPITGRLSCMSSMALDRLCQNRRRKSTHTQQRDEMLPPSATMGIITPAWLVWTNWAPPVLVLSHRGSNCTLSFFSFFPFLFLFFFRFHS